MCITLDPADFLWKGRVRLKQAKVIVFPTLSFAREKGESTERTLEKIC